MSKPIQIVNISFVPNLAILDPNFLLSFKENTLSIFIADIFAHCCEGYISIASTSLLKSISKSSLELLKSGTSKIKIDSIDITGLSEIMYAEHLAGIVQGNAFVGVAHAIAHAMEYLLKISHANAILTVIKPTLQWLKEIKNQPELDYFIEIYDA